MARSFASRMGTIAFRLRQNSLLPAPSGGFGTVAFLRTKFPQVHKAPQANEEIMILDKSVPLDRS